MTRARCRRGPRDPKMDPLSLLYRRSMWIKPLFELVSRSIFAPILVTDLRILFYHFLARFWDPMVKNRPQNDFRPRPSTENRRTPNLMILPSCFVVFSSEIVPKIRHFDIQIAYKTGLQKNCQTGRAPWDARRGPRTPQEHQSIGGSIDRWIDGSMDPWID